MKNTRRNIEHKLNIYCEIIFNDVILENIDFIGEINNFKENVALINLSALQKYIITYNSYMNMYYKNVCIAIHNQSFDFLRKFIFSLENKYKIKFKNEEIVAYLIKFLLNSEEFKILTFLIPELEEIINLLLNGAFSLQSKKFTYFVLGTIFFKFHFLKENIRSEILNNPMSSDLYINSPMLLSFTTSIQSFLLISLTKNKIIGTNNYALKVLFFKNFINFISVMNIYKKHFEHHFCLNLTKKVFFEKVMFSALNAIKIENDKGYLWQMNNTYTNFDELMNLNDFNSTLKNFLMINQDDQIENISNDLKEKVSKIKDFFLRFEQISE